MNGQVRCTFLAKDRQLGVAGLAMQMECRMQGEQRPGVRVSWSPGRQDLQRQRSAGWEKGRDPGE